LVGNHDTEVKGVLITLDVTEKVVQEAIDRSCNVIVAHHPIIFKGLKSLTGKNYVERTVLMAIKNDIAIYAIHTNLDNVNNGVNQKICNKIGLNQTRILKPKTGLMSKLITLVPQDVKEDVLNALYNAGAGQIGNYKNCSFSSEGTGTFTPSAEANPAIGVHNKPETVKEHRVEVIFPSHLTAGVVNSLKAAHPYEEVAYYVNRLENENQEVGSGMIGILENEMEPIRFLKLLKNKMNLKCIRHTEFSVKKIKTVAVCGGSGSFLLGAAKAQSADVFITADFKYHEFFDAEGSTIIADIGHYESEVFTKELLHDILSKKFDKFALNLSNIDTNPISYI
ncbi:MAG: Nif3-like dinuclear metal center hexameric protein, partial [Bacteroidota bacterium]